MSHAVVGSRERLPGMPRANRSDVARLAGVAPTTVSNVLNGRGAVLRISPDTIARVQGAADQLGYVPNAAASALRGRRSHTLVQLLGALPPSPHVPIVHELLTSAIAVAAARQFLVLPAVESYAGGGVKQAQQLITDVDLAGAVVELNDQTTASGRRLAELDVPVVWMSLHTPSELPPGLAHVAIDQRPGVHEILSRLELGEGQRLAVMVGPTYGAERVEVARELFGSDLLTVEADSWLPEAGEAAARAALRSHPEIGAFFCADDLLAVGAIRSCEAEGRAVPTDVSVIGFGGYDLPLVGPLALTTVRWPLRELTTAAFTTLIEHLQTVGKRRPLVGDGPGHDGPLQAPLLTTLPSVAVPGATARLASSRLR